ncbi:phosphotransferase [Streptomyces sp. UNOC14_S4]|uniref:phosphotransferase n=1 Tax=Streptomyces sp. UNOC14_S4 TaxID=2872340 RepID=UPI001E526738|nr:phosphotransferase [Streptomyces sp. UNOC14_S4]MCC3768768.1 aminoglycoside phosphotransferase family protein [Streptomyces sp. UNOC14_S4]
MVERVGWEELPAALRGAVEARTGRVTASRTVVDGLNCVAALVLDTERSGRLFFKGVREADAKAVAALGWEARVNEAVRGVGPLLLHRFRDGGWSCLAFAHIDGRHVDLGPGSNDLAAVSDALRRMQTFSASGLPAPPLADRYAAHLLPGDAECLSGTSLLHTDTNPHNIMIGNGDGVAYIVDWAMPATGPAWVDAACTAVRLMECGQSPADALTWLGGFASWRHADPESVEAFVHVTCRDWTATIGERDAAPSNARFRHLLGFPHEGH